MFLTLSEWYRAPIIFKLATICYVRRENDAENDEKIRRLAEEYEDKYGARIIPIDAKVREVSSTELRLGLQTGNISVKKMLPEKVYKYISQRGLYR